MSIGKVAGSGGSAFDTSQIRVATPLAPQEVGKEQLLNDRRAQGVQQRQHQNRVELTDDDESRLVKRMAEMLNESARWSHKRLRFVVHDKTERLMVQVLDVETEEVIREIPPEEMLDLVSRIHEMIGLFIDEIA